MSARYRYATDVATPPPSASPVASGIPIPTVTTSLTPHSVPLVFPWGNPALLSSPLPSYFRCTINAIPSTKVLADQCGIPIGFLVHPGAVANVPIVDCSLTDVIRCSECSAYLSPYCEVLPGGQGFRCCCCGHVNEMRGQYNPGLSQTTEFVSPVYDILAPLKYVTSPLIGPCFLFMIDLSVDSVSTGFTFQCLSSIKASLSSLPDTTRVGLLTMSNVVTVYDFRHSLEYIVADLSDPVLPFQCASLLSKHRSAIEARIDFLLSKSGEAWSTGHCFGSALLVAQAALVGIGGIIVACCAGPPTVGPLLITPRPREPVPEVTFLRPPDGGIGQAYREIGRFLNETSASVHLFNLAVPGRSSDIAITSLPSGLTSGAVHFYHQFDPAALHRDLYECISGRYLWDASLRPRCTTGARLSTATGNLTVRDRTVFCPVLHHRDSIAFELRIESATPRVVVQCAILFTDTSGKRLIRVMSFSVPTVSDLEPIRSHVDEAVLAAFFVKRAGSMATAQGVPEAANSLKAELRALSAKGFRLVSLHHLIHALVESPLLRPSHREGPDGRMAALVNARAFSLVDALLYLYPRMFAIDGGSAPLALTMDAFGAGNVIVVHTFARVFVWVSPNASREVVREFFGREEVPMELGETTGSAKLHGLVNECYAMSGRYLPVEVIQVGSPRESVFAEILVDVAKDGGGDLEGFLRETMAFR